MKKILIIEDERTLSEILITKLKKEGYDILATKDGESGLSMAINEHPDLILLDFVLPGLDGMSLLKKLREDNWGKTAQVIILTNLSDAENAEEAASHGVFDYLIKAEWKLEDVIKKVKQKIG